MDAIKVSETDCFRESVIVTVRDAVPQTLLNLYLNALDSMDGPQGDLMISPVTLPGKWYRN